MPTPDSTNEFHSGKRLRAYRERQGWSMEQLAEILDLSVKTIARYEKGGLSEKKAGYIAETLDIDPGCFSNDLPWTEADFKRRLDFPNKEKNILEELDQRRHSASAEQPVPQEADISKNHEQSPLEELDQPLTDASPDFPVPQKSDALKNREKREQELIEVIGEEIGGFLDNLLGKHEYWPLNVVETEPVHSPKVSYRVKFLTNPSRKKKETDPSPSVFNGSVFPETGNFLILGEPGTGKTTNVAKWGMQALEKAIASEEAPIPIMIHLEEWNRPEHRIPRKNNFLNRVSDAFKSPDALIPPEPLLDFVARVLKRKYGLNPAYIKEKLKRNQWFLLLDGLDEVRIEYQEECLTRIQEFVEETQPRSLVISCRVQEYDSLSDKLETVTRLEVKSFTSEQMQDHLNAAGLDKVFEVLERDPTFLQEMSTALMLHILIETAPEVDFPGLWEQKSSVEAKVDQVWEIYVDLALAPELDTKAAPLPLFNPCKSKTLQWLKQLAYWQKEHFLAGVSLNDGGFDIESFQPQAMLTSWQKVKHRSLVFAVYLMAVWAVAIPLNLSLYGAFQEPATPLIIFFMMTMMGVYGGVMGIFSPRVELKEKLDWKSKSSYWGSLAVAVISLLVWWLGPTYHHWILSWLPSQIAASEDPEWKFVISCSFGMAGMVFMHEFFWARKRSNKKEGVSAFPKKEGEVWKDWYLRQCWSPFWIPFNLFLLALCLGAPLVLYPFFDEVGFMGVVYIVVLMTFMLINSKKVKKRTYPNQGLHQTMVTKSIMWGLGTFFAVSLMLWTIPNEDPSIWPWFVVGTVLVTVYSALLIGLGDGIRHWTLRYVLWKSDQMPPPKQWRAFLDYMVHCSLLRQVGGSYGFYHARLRDYLLKL